MSFSRKKQSQPAPAVTILQTPTPSSHGMARRSSSSSGNGKVFLASRFRLADPDRILIHFLYNRPKQCYCSTIASQAASCQQPGHIIRPATVILSLVRKLSPPTPTRCHQQAWCCATLRRPPSHNTALPFLPLQPLTATIHFSWSRPTHYTPPQFPLDSHWSPCKACFEGYYTQRLYRDSTGNLLELP